MKLTGCITALATPFRENGEVDPMAWSKLVEKQLEGGVNGLVVAGSTGEAAALTGAEFNQLITATVKQVAGRVPVIAGTGQSCTAKTISQTQRARDAGADAALVVTPPYVRPTAEGLIAHYRAVADAVDLPVILYNVPGRTGCDLQPETTAELAKHPNIVGLKEARVDEARWQALFSVVPRSFSLLSGDDPTFVRAMLGGASGVVSVASNVVPASFRQICDALAAGNSAQAMALDEQLHDLFEFLGVEPNPIPVKAILSKLGLGHGLRLPLTRLSAQHAELAQSMLRLVTKLETQALATAAA